MISEHLKLILCPSCKGDRWADQVTKIKCNNCGESYPAMHHVVSLLPDYEETSETRDILDYVRPIASRLGLQGEEEAITELGNILNESKNHQAATTYLTAEMRDVVDRFQIFNVDFSVSYLKHYFESSLEPGITLYRNLRVKNTGKFPWSSQDTPPLYLSYHWLDEDRETIVHDGNRTAFPVIIECGREITLPVQVTTPTEPGKYILQILFIQEGIRWVDESIHEINIEICQKNAQPIDIKRTTTENYQYQSDHMQGIKMIEDYIKENYNHSLEFLEIGCGAHPQVAYLEIPNQFRSINADINLSLLKIGSLFYRYNHPLLYNKLTFMSFDANEPPLKKESFDGIVLFAALHHFPEPDRLLKSCYDLLKSDGFVAIMCEPVNKTMYDETTVKELSKGINEQVFSEEEYLNLFKGCNFRIERVQIDNDHSLKVILSKQSKSAQ